ncbi:MAG: DUF4065 domain-containing protein [Lachnospiraceae bacterium]|nr:DUF4065 domain-containing protein [Lachnospiraceae bacterium]
MIGRVRNAKEVAKYIIAYCGQKGYSISNLKLQKILYFVQAEFLVATGMPCFREEIEAWDFGPVVPEVYRQYKIFGSANIPTFIIRGRMLLDDGLINRMVDECAKYTLSQLVEITHNQTPWIEANKMERRVIYKDTIENYFR